MRASSGRAGAGTQVDRALSSAKDRCESGGSVEALNRDCLCVGADVEALRSRLEESLPPSGAGGAPFDLRPHLFAAHPVFLAREQVEEMARIVAACENVIDSPGFRARALSAAPEIARDDPGPRGAFIGYDFHLG